MDFIEVVGLSLNSPFTWPFIIHTGGWISVTNSPFVFIAVSLTIT